MIRIHEFNYEEEFKICLNKVTTLIPTDGDYGLKDIYCIKDQITSANSKMLKSYKPPYTATIVKLLAEKPVHVPCDEFAMGTYGIYPYTLKYPGIPHYLGGSSSGSAYYLYTREDPAYSIGSDTGGSIRYPAAINNFYGLKPSYGLISRYGLIPYCELLDTVGIMVNKIQLLAPLFKRLCVKDPKDLTQKINEVTISNPQIYTTFKSNYKYTDSEDTDIKLDQIYMDIILPYVFSNLNKYDGFRFQSEGYIQGFKSIPKEIATEKRSTLFGPHVKKRISLGYKRNTKAVNLLYKYRYNIDNELLQEYPILKRWHNFFNQNFLVTKMIPARTQLNIETINKPEGLSALANILGIPSLAFQYKGEPYELMGPRYTDLQLIDILKWLKLD